jgi:ribosomal protein S19E (S16A)
MTGLDTRMDERANPLPVKCPHCTMPDLDFVAKPYLLTRGFAGPAETAPAELGNFLVRDRVRKMLEVAVPSACSFVPTAENKSKKPIQGWWLAVPTGVVDMPGLPLSSKKDGRCEKCGEPSLGYYPYVPTKGKPSEYRHVGLDKCDCRGLDVFKPKQWSAVDTLENQYAEALKYTEKGEEPPAWSNFGGPRGVKDPPPHAQRWTRVNISRELFFSVRLEQLLEKAKVKGQLIRALNERVPQLANVQPSADDLEWIEDKLQLLVKAGLVDAKAAVPAKKSGGADKWFNEYLKKNAAKKPPPKIDFAAIEKNRKLTLPKDYKDFVSIIGPKAFKNVMEIDGFTARVLAPKQLDFKDYRRDKWDELGVKSDVDGIAFAATDHGDVFIFDASKNGHAIFWYDHEQNAVEPFAASFAGCIKRFDQRS